MTYEISEDAIEQLFYKHFEMLTEESQLKTLRDLIKIYLGEEE